MNKPVSFQLAQSLYNKNYNNPCSHYYEHALTSQIDEETGNNTGAFGWEKGETNLNSHYFINKSIDIDFSNENWFMCAAPTITEVIIWLYEEYGIWINVDCDCYGELWYADLSVASKNNWDNIDLRHEIISATKKFPNEHNSPTEAYEAAILYTLNNLI